MRRVVLLAPVVVAMVVVAMVVVSGCKSSNSGPAKISVDQAELLFGQETGGATLLGTAPINTLQITNTGGDTLTISSVTVGAGTTDPCGKDAAQLIPCGSDAGLTLDAPQVFSASAASATSLDPGKTALVQVVFTPTSVGFFGAVLTIASNASNTPNLTVELDGDSVAPILSTPGWDGGVIELGTLTLTQVTLPDGGPGYLGGLLPDGGISNATFTVSNVGAVDLTFAADFADGGTASCTGSQCAELSTDAGDPSVVIPTWSVMGPIPSDIPPVRADGVANTAQITVNFGPYFPGDYTQHVNVATNSANVPVLSFTVHGTATAP